MFRDRKCTAIRLTNVIDHLLNKQSAAKGLLGKIAYSESRAECGWLRDQFAAPYRKPCSKTVEKQNRDWNGW